MGRVEYKKGYLHCKQCGQRFKKEDCPIHKSKVQTYHICPNCKPKWKLRSKPQHANFARHKDPIWLEARKF